MSDFFNGYMAGESMARVNDAAGELADTVARSFRQLGAKQPDLTTQLRDELYTSKSKSIVAEAAFGAFKKCAENLPEPVRRALEASIAQNFQAEFMARVQRDGLNTADFNMRRVVEAWTPKIR